MEWQIRVASGNRLPKLQKDLKINGHAFEARIYAENPENNFLPDTGKLVHLRTPEATNTIRIETGVREGDEVSIHYDPMISKLVVWSENRKEALRVLEKALGEFEVVGPSTNIEFLKNLASHPSFIEGDVETGFIKKHYESLFKKRSVPAEIYAQAALFLISEENRSKNNSDSPWDDHFGFRMNSNLERTFTFFIDKDRKESVVLKVKYLLEGKYFVEMSEADGKTYFSNCELHDSEDKSLLISTCGDSRLSSNIVLNDGVLNVFGSGFRYCLYMPLPSYNSSADISSESSLITPMPCKISKVEVKAGDVVKKGQTLIILEAMKMEVFFSNKHIMKSPKDGVISKVSFQVGELVGQGKRLITFKE